MNWPEGTIWQRPERWEDDPAVEWWADLADLRPAAVWPDLEEEA